MFHADNNHNLKVQSSQVSDGTSDFSLQLDTGFPNYRLSLSVFYSPSDGFYKPVSY